MDLIKGRKGISSFTLHLIAMALMLCDHLWATVIPGNMWLTLLGRSAFPIFAFMIAEGYYHTRNIKQYLLRLLLGALISEIPFNLMYGGSIFYPYHQNVLWTFLIALTGISLIEKIRAKKRSALTILSAVGIVLLCTALGFLCMVDYYGYGILTVFLFYALHKKSWWTMVLQLIGLYFINVTIFGGMLIDLPLFGHTFEIHQQGLAILAVLPIWLYDGHQGPHSKTIRYCFYGFYPVHMLVLSLISLYIL